MNIDVERITCCKCFVAFWVSEEHKQKLVSSKNGFFCPNGHSQNFVGKTDADKTKEAEADAKHWRTQHDFEYNENKMLKKSVTEYKSQLTKLKNKGSKK